MNSLSSPPVLEEQPSTNMKFAALSVLALLALASAEEGRKSHEKRSPVGYPSPTSRPAFASGGASSGVSYTKSAIGGSGQKSFTPSQLHYASQASDDAASSAPVSFGNAQQQYDFQAPAFGKAFASGQSTPYSPASDVSSFAFNSPSVQYNSLGYLQQFAGKLSAAAPADQTQQFSFPAAPGKFASFSAPASGPVTFAAAPQSAQKYAFAAPAFAGSAGAKYQFAASPQQVLFAAAPQHPAYQSFAGGAPLQAANSQQVYAVAPSQQYAYTTNNKYAGAAGYAAQ